MFFVTASRSLSVDDVTVASTVPASTSACSAAPSSKERPITGSVTGAPSVPVSSSWRPSWPSLKMITAS